MEEEEVIIIQRPIFRKPTSKATSSSSIPVTQPTYQKNVATTSSTTSSFVFIGIPMESPESIKPSQNQNQTAPVWRQDARDERGRRRFHGAFTGGFSAGYFNTVGSKEGWAPSSFTSSRKDRSKSNALKPEDFMDEEDIQDILGPKKVQATETYDTLGSTEKDLKRKQAIQSNMAETGGILGALPGKFVDDLVLPISEPIGIKLLKQLGWREGQGIGPRAKRVFSKEKEDIYAEKHLFAPEDQALTEFKQKKDFFGIGFDPYVNAPEFHVASLGNDSNEEEKRKKLKISHSGKGNKSLGGGFGVGALEEEDDDIYDVPSLDKYNINIEDDEFTPLKKPSKVKTLNDLEIKNKALSTVKKSRDLCRDGSSPLRGFILASIKEKLTKWFPPLPVPPGYVAQIKQDSEVVQGTANTIKHPGSKDKRSRVLPGVIQERSALLGETPLNAPARSVFDYLSEKDKERLKSFSQTLKEGPSTDLFVIDTSKQTIPLEHAPSLHEQKVPIIPNIPQEVASEALKGFLPFQSDLPKLNRYKAFLSHKSGQIAELDLIPYAGRNAGDITKELNEFAQAAFVFRPMSTAMAKRFTTGSSDTVMEMEKSRVDKGGIQDISDNSQNKDSDKKNTTSSTFVIPHGTPATAAEAAKVGMYGTLTRTILPFKPARLLCKRMNIAEPETNYDSNTSETLNLDKVTKEVLNEEKMQQIMVASGQPHLLESIQQEKKKISEMNDKTIPEQDSQIDGAKPMDAIPEKNVLSTIPERPPMDIFKAIFDNSDTESENDDDKNDDVDPKQKEMEMPDHTQLYETLEHIESERNEEGFINNTTSLQEVKGNLKEEPEIKAESSWTEKKVKVKKKKEKEKKKKKTSKSKSSSKKKKDKESKKSSKSRSSRTKRKITGSDRRSSDHSVDSNSEDSSSDSSGAEGDRRDYSHSKNNEIDKNLVWREKQASSSRPQARDFW